MQPYLPLGKFAFPQTNLNPKLKTHLAVSSELQQAQPLQMHCVLGSNHVVQTLATVVLRGQTKMLMTHKFTCGGQGTGPTSFCSREAELEIDMTQDVQESRAPPENEK